MKRVGVISTAILFLLLGTTAPAYAQHEQQGKEQGKSQGGQQHQQARSAPQQHSQQASRPAQQQHSQQAGSPAQRQHQQQARRSQPQERPQGNYGSVYHGGVQPNGPTYGGVHHSGVPQHQGQVYSGFAQSRARSWDNDHRSWAQRGGYNGYRIPDDRFRTYFGSNHYFRINALPMAFVGGYPRFQYDGYGVTFVDPWPESWPANWYQTDDVYLDYNNDGYYLYNRMRPGSGIAVTFAF